MSPRRRAQRPLRTPISLVRSVTTDQQIMFMITIAANHNSEIEADGYRHTKNDELMSFHNEKGKGIAGLDGEVRLFCVVAEMPPPPRH